MGKVLGGLSVAALLLAGTMAAAPVATAAPRSVSDCVDYAVDEGGAAVTIAYKACTDDSILGCYRIFRDHYGRQAWALEACKRRV
ncbi:hypothetical protein [Amycolatopsis sp. NPDC049868]|uniref:hypothetical protein n=1 Tax=Amycolatopsis sp. NPDC049868 TaxID=3363934 RepID=UPI00379455A6